MPDINVNRWKTELIAGGFRPQRFGFPVRMVRKLLWPFVRPFHFYTLEEVGRSFREIDRSLDEVARTNERTERHVNEVEARSTEALQSAEASMRDGLGRLADTQSLLRTELAAAINRHLGVESEVATLAERLLACEEQVRSCIEVAGPLLAAKLGAIEERTEAGLAHLERIDRRTRLFVANTPTGLFLLKDGDYISDSLARDGAWDSHILGVCADVAARRSGIAIDVGGHIGALTVPMARLFQSVVTFEPNRFNFALLMANVALNGLTNVECLNQALYSREAELSLGSESQQEIPLPAGADGGLDWTEARNLGAFLFTENGMGAFTTQAHTLDSHALNDVAFMKVDAQGADGEVIKGALETIRRSEPVIVFEWEALLSREFGVDFEEVRSALETAGYTISVLKKHNEKQTDYLARPRTR